MTTPTPPGYHRAVPHGLHPPGYHAGPAGECADTTCHTQPAPTDPEADLEVMVFSIATGGAIVEPKAFKAALAALVRKGQSTADIPGTIAPAGPAETIARLRMDLEQAREQLDRDDSRHRREMAALEAERDGWAEALNNLLAIDKPSAALARVQAFAEQLEGFADDALTIPDRKLYATLAGNLRAAIQGRGDAEVGR